MISTPFQRTRVCLELAPRMKTEVVFPSEPVRLTLSPGTSRSTSATLRAARSSMSFFVMTVMLIPRGTMPRIRIDLMIRAGWTRLLVLSFANIFLTMLLVSLGIFRIGAL